MPSIQLDLQGTVLGGDAKLVLAGPGDNVQELDAAALLANHHHSAVFFGDRVDLDLVPSSGGQHSRIVIPAYTAHGLCSDDDDPDAASICGDTDDRVLSSDVRVARLIPGGCTAWLISEDVYVTAGHCQAPTGSTRLHFSGGTSAPVADQYPVDPSSYDEEADGVGSDWGVGRTLPNTSTGLKAGEAQGAKCTGAACGWFALGTVPDSPGNNNIRITGYGTAAVNSFWQKTHVGALVTVQATALKYIPDTTVSCILWCRIPHARAPS